MTIINTVYSFPKKKRYRVLHDESQRALVWLYDIDDPKGFPFSMRRHEFLDLIQAGKAAEIQDPWASQLLQDDQLSDAERKRVNDLWKSVSSLVFDMPRILVRRHRGKIIAEFYKNGGHSRPTLLNGLRLCWAKGLTKSALVPNYSACGAPGKRRISEKKLGRHRTLSHGDGVNVTDDMLKLMEKHWKESYLKRGRRSLRGAYDRYKAEAIEKYCGASNGDILVFKEKYKQIVLPTFKQFVYWFHRKFNSVDVLKAQKGWNYFNANVRTIINNMRSEVRGIGSRYVLDATTADNYIVSIIDRNRIVGRPTVYLIVDVETRVIVGFYVGLEPPSYEAAMLAMLNVFEDKVALCAKYGIPITPDMWPNAPTCHSLLSDGGEMIGKAADALVGPVIQDLETAPPFRGDAKSVTERSFDTVQIAFGPFTPGHVVKPMGTRGERDPRLGAAYTLFAFTKAIILSIIQANNVERRDFDGSTAVIEAGTPYIPTRLWQYYLNEHLVDTPNLNYDFVARAVRPRKDVKVRRRGVHFGPGLYYYSEELLAQDWFLPMALANGELKAAYDSSDMTEIEVWSPLDPKQTFKCQLTPHSSRFKGCSLSEVNALRRRETTNVYDFHVGEDGQGYDPEAIRAFIAAEQEALKQEQLAARQAEFDPNLSDKKRTDAIRDNRRAELKLDKQRRKQALLEGVAATDHPSQSLYPQELDSHESRLLDKLSESINRSNNDED